MYVKIILVIFSTKLLGKSSKPNRRLHSCRIENDKLLYDGRWYHKGQGVALKSKDIDSK